MEKTTVRPNKMLSKEELEFAIVVSRHKFWDYINYGTWKCSCGLCEWARGGAIKS
jgi:hypothetical protein